jgi:hypothetical protein
MRQSPLLLLFLGLSATVQADSLSDENTRLKQQVSALQSRVETLEHACPTASSAVVVQPGAAATAPSVPPPVRPAPATPVAVTAPPPPDTSLTAAANIEGTPTPLDSGGSSIFSAAPKQKYADTGCDRSLFSGPAAGPWQKLSNWKAVTKGLTPAEVEAAIGVEHYDVQLRGGRTQWQYGRCNSSYESVVEFLDGRVVSVVPPDQ